MTNGVPVKPGLIIPFSELEFVTSRSAGPGGQNVNKLETRVEVRFNVHRSRILMEQERALILEKLANRIDRNGVLRVVSQESRSQWKNKQTALDRLAKLVRRALQPSKRRKPTGIPPAVRRKRLDSKRKRSEVKRLRRPPAD
ncbi:MAG: aminoacyl-tRNA hydrolase [Bacteroidia bacterium]|nr:MAG: aminoacyl-tRNA hydrolase [Bacteroidia bacterium]